jgi:hypothetical protein
VIVDGEIAALDEKGRSSFQLLQLFKKSENVPLVYYVFDLLSLEGKDLRDQPLSVRRKALANVLKRAPDNFRLSDELRGGKEDLARVAQEVGLEGLVAKKKTSVYESGRRSGAYFPKIFFFRREIASMSSSSSASSLSYASTSITSRIASSSKLASWAGVRASSLQSARRSSR